MLIVGVPCLLCALAVPGVWSFLRVTHATVVTHESSHKDAHSRHMVQWSEDVIKADPFFGRSRVRFRVPPLGFEHNCT